MEYKISVWSSERENWKQDEGVDSPGLPSEKYHDFARECGKRSRAYPNLLSDKPGAK